MSLSKLLTDWSKDPNPELAKLIFNQTIQLYPDKFNTQERHVLIDFLNKTSQPIFLQNLSRTERYQWAETVFKILQTTQFHLLELFRTRVEQHPNRTLFQEFVNEKPVFWSYQQVYRQINDIAALFLNAFDQPRVAIFSANSVYSAMVDLACLFFGIYDTPLNIHFNEKILLNIFKDLKINIIVTDTEARLETIQKVTQQLPWPTKIFTTFQINEKNNLYYLQLQAHSLNYSKKQEVLLARPVRDLNRVITTMFTSGSTGLPKGVSFSEYNLISKRFARGAALPCLGDSEVLLSYLPLFHTFGRYLELLGSIYWHGTYVFVGNNSAETLLKLFPQVQPTIFISIPLRWLNLYEKINEQTHNLSKPKLIQQSIQQIMGSRFKWGLSAAGYLPPYVFKFFQDNNINLCSGFGMTEATGGITMTPPFEYIEDSVGIPLPGIYTRLNQKNELEISGHYVARYFSQAKAYDIIPYPQNPQTDFWLKTGDVFVILPNGHHKIVDRVKDIYKNNKGQTIAPKVIESKFENVPGIKQVFLVGDARPYNVLLIVPDFDSDFYKNVILPNSEQYFRQIINTANKDVAPYERVVNFAVLNRQLSVEKGELTPKGSFNRKIIEQNFKHIIDNLYKSDKLVLQNKHVKIIIPRWFLRDLGIVESDLILTDKGLLNRFTGNFLYIKHFKKNMYFIGDLIYRLKSNTIDLGLLARQPRLWMGNPQVINFCPYKIGWDIPIDNFIERIRIQGDYQVIYLQDQIPKIKSSKSKTIDQINTLVTKALFSTEPEAINAINQLAEKLQTVDKNLCQVIRCRLQALAYSPYENIRILAYRVLLLYDPNPDYKRSFPEFLLSGKTYLNEESINIIAKSNLGPIQLQALRERLYAYRTKLKWDLNETRRMHFEYIFKLLYNFTKRNFNYLPSVRAELSSWALHTDSPALANAAKKYLKLLMNDFDSYIRNKFKNRKRKIKDLLVFGIDISKEEKKRLIDLFKNTFFLEKSIILAFNEPNFSIDKIKPHGIWIVKLQSVQEFRHYRLGINTTEALHYDLHVIISRNPKRHLKEETSLWMNAISGFPVGPRVMPIVGYDCAEKGVISTSYLIGLTVWDKIKEYTNIHRASNYAIRQKHWKKLFIRAFTAFFRAAKYSGFKIVPGIVSPNNVTVPELNFKQDALINYLIGWKPLKKNLDLILPMIIEFYQTVSALYPWAHNMLKLEWIFDASVEALGQKQALNFLEKLYKELTSKDFKINNQSLAQIVKNYINYLQNSFYFPLALELAIEQYKEWSLINPYATAKAKSQTIEELIDLYKLNKWPAIVRFKFYAQTYFQNASEPVKQKFQTLIDKMAQNPNQSPLQLIELSDLQAAINNDEDLQVFTRMIFPKLAPNQRIELYKIHRQLSETVVVKTELKDKFGISYTFREPLKPSEVGELYRLFYQENYPKNVSEQDKHLILIDKYDRVIGGLAYKELEDKIVLLDGLVVTSSLQGRGLGTAMIEDFFCRMQAKGVKIIKAHFLFGNYYLKHNFHVDKKWGALVKYLNE